MCDHIVTWFLGSANSHSQEARPDVCSHAHLCCLINSNTVLLCGYAADTPCVCGGQALEWLFSVSSSSVTNSGAFVNNEVQDVFLVCRHRFSCGWHLC